MTKEHGSSVTGRRRGVSGSHSTARTGGPHVVLPPPTGRAAAGSTGPTPHRLVVAHDHVLALPEAGRRLYVQGLMQSVQRQSTTAGSPVAQRKPNAQQVRASRILAQLRILITAAEWPTIRRRVYPQQSAAGIARAKERKAGRTTDLTGLGQIASLDRFAGAMRSIRTDWPQKSVRERVAAIGAAANTELTQAGVPRFLIVDSIPMTAKGTFSRGDWAFSINEDLVSTPRLDAATAGMVANAAMHESRHAEQHFLAARYSAGFNKTDQAGLVAEQGIAAPIAQEAVRRKFNAMSDMAVASLGQRMHKAFVTDAVATQAAAGELDPARDAMQDRRTEAGKAAAALGATVSVATITAAERARDALTASIAEVERAYAVYRSVPYEADAHEVGDAAELAFQGWP